MTRRSPAVISLILWLGGLVALLVGCAIAVVLSVASTTKDPSSWLDFLVPLVIGAIGWILCTVAATVFAFVAVIRHADHLWLAVVVIVVSIVGFALALLWVIG